MKLISSKSTFLFKRGFPTVWFGSLFVFFALTITFGVTTGESKDLPIILFMLIIPIIMAVFSYFLMRALVWDLADEVYDMGDYLLVRKSSKEENISLKT